jgi:DNA-binding response OmpR family regulator
MKFKILVCDDDADIRRALKIYLNQADYEVVEAENGQIALDILANQSKYIHLILLDVMMPVLDGIDTAVKIRESSNVPIIFLSAKSEDVDQILGLKMGADDYITKPFNPVELLARIEATLRRYARLGGLSMLNDDSSELQNKQSEEGLLQTGGLVLNQAKKKVMVDGKEVMLTALEYKILELLISHLDQVFTSDQIYEAVWNESAYQATKTVSVHIRHLREKIEINPKEPRYLKVIYGLGYKMVKIL